jgi:hypothetical protein
MHSEAQSEFLVVANENQSGWRFWMYGRQSTQASLTGRDWARRRQGISIVKGAPCFPTARTLPAL